MQEVLEQEGAVEGDGAQRGLQGGQIEGWGGKKGGVGKHPLLEGPGADMETESGTRRHKKEFGGINGGRLTRLQAIWRRERSQKSPRGGLRGVNAGGER